MSRAGTPLSQCVPKKFLLPMGNKIGGAQVYILRRNRDVTTISWNEKHPENLAAYHMKKERNNGRKASSEMMMIPSADGELDSRGRREVGRRSFLKGLGMAGATLLPASALLIQQAKAQEDKDKNDDNGGKLSEGDASILRFLAAAEILESDLWEQYWELGGNQTADFASPNPATGTKPTPTGGNPLYTSALTILDGDMPQYIQDNTDDEFSHANFLIAYLKSKGANTEDIDLFNGPHFRRLPGSMAKGSTR